MSISHVRVTILIAYLFSSPAIAEIMTCNFTYNLKGWSLFYKTYEGAGVVACQNGQRANVSIVAKGGGLTIGKSEIENGKGVFSEVNSINDVFGTYASADSHAGVTKSIEAWAMSKGEVALILSGKGRGFDLGFSFGGFTIKRN